MPYPNEHSCRVRDPGDFQKGSFKSKVLPKSKGGKGGVRIIIGRLKGEKTTTVQAYRFPKDKYTAAEAKQWLKDNDVTCKEFEAAKEEREIAGGLQKIWGQFVEGVKRELGLDEQYDDEWGDNEDPVRAIGTWRLMQQFYALLRATAVSDEYPSVVDIYFDDGSLYGLVVAGGKLYQYPLDIAGDDLQITGERVQVAEVHQPTAGERGVTVHRQADGRVRLMMIASTAVLNRVSEIDSTTLFDNMVERAKGEAGYPYITLWHCGEPFGMGRADFLARDGYVYIASGLLDEGNELAEAVARDVEAAPDFWGTSIRYRPVGEPEMIEIAEDVRIPVYRDGINIEISLLPEKYAASWFTASGTAEEVQRMKAEVEDLLKKLLGDKADSWIARIDGVNRQIEEEGMIARSEGSPDGTPPGEVKPVKSEADAQETAPQPVVELDDEATAALARAIAGSQEFTDLLKPAGEATAKFRADLDALAEKLEEIGAATAGRLDALERTDAEKQREWLADLPPQSSLRVTYRPRLAAATPPPGGDGQGDDPAAVALEKIRAAKGNIR